MFELFGGLLLACLPALPILAILRRLDRARPEPLGLIGKSVLYGFLAVAPAALIEILLDDFMPHIAGILGHIVEAFVAAALVEEGVKLWFIRRSIWRRGEFDEVADGIVYAVSVSLGFAVVENFIYTWNDPGLLVLRSVTAVPLHAIATGLMGFWLGLEKMRAGDRVSGAKLPKGGWKKGLLVALSVHGLYDFLLFEGGAIALLVFPLLVAGAFALRRQFVLAKSIDDTLTGIAALTGEGSLAGSEKGPRSGPFLP